MQPSDEQKRKPEDVLCQDCRDTGLRDSGGVQPWGEAISLPCNCGAQRGAPIRYEYRWLNPGGGPERKGARDWFLLEPRTAGQTMQQLIADMLGYRFGSKPVYEVRPLYAGPVIKGD